MFAAAPPTKTESLVPAWAADAVWYQIFPERFRNGDTANDPTRDTLELPTVPTSQWRPTPWTSDWYTRAVWETELGPDFYANGVFHRRYGGDLKGVIEKLDYLADLGVNALYFNPLFQARSLHKYDGSSFHHIDPYFGPDPLGDLALIAKETADPATWQWTAADKLFLELVAKAHEKGMRVIIDGVFNHTGRDFFAFADVRKKGRESLYYAWYQILTPDDPATARFEFDYKGWWGHKSLPLFSASEDGTDLHPGPKAYVFDITKRWMDPDGDGDPKDGVDGWRLDVADERPATFWASWNDYVRSINPKAYTVAETWKDSAQFIADGHFSAAMNYWAFALPTKGFLIDNKITADVFGELLNTRRKAFPQDTAFAMQNLIDSHDTPRLASMIVNAGTIDYTPETISLTDGASPRANPKFDIRKPNARELKIQKLFTLFQMTYLGAPMVYYGTEAGVWGGHDPDCRKPMIWTDLTYDDEATDPRGGKRTRDSVKFDAGLFPFYKNAIALRNTHKVLRTGSFEVLAADKEKSTFAYVRDIPGESPVIVAINRSEAEQIITIRFPVFKGVKLTPPTVALTTDGAPEDIKLEIATDKLSITIPALTGAVLVPFKK